MKVFFINNDGGGFADHIDINEGTTIVKFLGAQLNNVVDRDVVDSDGETPLVDLSNYMIRVNRDVVDREYVLKDGDRVTCTPTKVDGAIEGLNR